MLEQRAEALLVDSDDTRVLEAEPGDYVTIARKAKGSQAWLLGAITDENVRIARAPLTFSIVATVINLH